MTATLLGFFLSYAGYFLVPAIGPRYTMTHLQTEALQGYALYPILREGLDALELEMRDCFPSGHTIIALIALWYGWKFHRALFWVLLPIVTALIFSTVYLRYHYVIDVAAGFVVAVVINLGTPYFTALLRGQGRTAMSCTAASSARAN